MDKPDSAAPRFYFAPVGTHPDTCPVLGLHTRTTCNYTREQLAKYGQHLPGCTQAPSSCSCGLIQAVLAQPMASTPVIAESAAAPRQPEGPQDLIDEELDVLAEVKRRRAQPADAATLGPEGEAPMALRATLEVARNELLNGGYPAAIRAINDARRLAAKPVPDALRDEALDALEAAAAHIDAARVLAVAYGAHKSEQAFIKAHAEARAVLRRSRRHE